MDNEQWEREAAEVSDKLSKLQRDAPLDVSGYLQQAGGYLNHALQRYRENREGESENDT